MENPGRFGDGNNNVRTILQFVVMKEMISLNIVEAVLNYIPSSME